MCSTSSIERNLTTIERFARQAKADMARLLVLPENAIFMGEPGTTQSLEIAESLDDPSDSSIIGKIKAICRENSLWVSLGGFQERAPSPGKIYNTHIILNDSGELVAKYRKMHLFDFPEGGLCESTLTMAGDSVEICATPFGITLGLSICFDLRFPGLYQSLRKKGANVMLIPAAFTKPTGEAGHWDVLNRARAIETQSYVVAAAQVGAHNERRES